jgi:M6 family metalloprotease-like protein
MWLSTIFGMKKFLAYFTVCGFLFVALATPVSAAVKTGAKCSKTGISSVASNKTFTCIKSGKKLVWDKGIPIFYGPKSNLSDPAQFAELDKCRIRHINPHATSMVAGFPVVDRRVDLVKGLKAQIIGVDFPDKSAAVPNVKSSRQYFINETERFWRDQSTVPLRFEWNWKEDWIRMPNPIKSYDLGGSFFEGKFRDEPYWSFVRNIISIADKTVDFTGINFIFIVFPDGIKDDEIGSFLVHTQGTYSTSEGSVYNLILAGGTYADLPTYIHEFGHGLGLTDIRDVITVGDQRSGEMYFDAMNNRVFPELLVWHRFLLGFLENQQIHCVTSQLESTHLIAPVAMRTNKLKGVVMPLSSTTGLIVEVRRPLGWDQGLSIPSFTAYGVPGKDLVGTVVYTLDTSVEYRRNPLKVVKVLRLGESITTNGHKISVIESGTFGDVVKVEKVS